MVTSCPGLAAETFQQFVPTESKVLDAGAGTGLVGVELHRLGYTNIHAMDMSQGMLDEAGRKGRLQQFLPDGHG